jgi:uncharacterized protein YceK
MKNLLLVLSSAVVLTLASGCCSMHKKCSGGECGPAKKHACSEACGKECSKEKPCSAECGGECSTKPAEKAPAPSK